MARITPDPHPKEVVELAFEIWAFLCDQNAVKTTERLNNPLPIDDWDPPQREVPYRTVAEWARSKKWADRASKRFKDLAPGIHSMVSNTIVAASVESASYLREVVNNPRESTKYRVDSAKTLLDRSGHMPWIRPSDDGKPIGPTQDYSESIAGKSTNELLAIALGKISDTIPDPDPDEVIDMETGEIT